MCLCEFLDTFRDFLGDNGFIFGKDNDTVWQNFQRIENQLRPKFTYGFAWTPRDLSDVRACFDTIEAICLKALGGEADAK